MGMIGGSPYLVTLHAKASLIRDHTRRRPRARACPDDQLPEMAGIAYMRADEVVDVAEQARIAATELARKLEARKLAMTQPLDEMV